MHRGKVDPGVSELPRGNELSRVHVNRPLVSNYLFSGPKKQLSLQLSLLRAHSCFENVEIDSTTITGTHNGSFWLLSSKTICNGLSITFKMDKL